MSFFVLRPGVTGKKVAAIFAERGLFCVAHRPRGERQFREDRFTNEPCELCYLEDHVLGVRLIEAKNAASEALLDELFAALPFYELEEALAQAEAARDAKPDERVATLGPLIACIAYSDVPELDARSYVLLAELLDSAEPALMRAVLCATAYLRGALLTTLLQKATAKKELSAEAERQLAIHSAVAAATDYVAHRQRAEELRAAGSHLAGLVHAHIALSLARRRGVKLHALIALSDELKKAFAAAPIPFDDGAFSALRDLNDLGRFHEVEEVATALAELSPPPLKLALAELLATALFGRGRKDLASETVTQALAYIDALSPEDRASAAVQLSRARLVALR